MSQGQCCSHNFNDLAGKARKPSIPAQPAFLFVDKCAEPGQIDPMKIFHLLVLAALPSLAFAQAPTPPAPPAGTGVTDTEVPNNFWDCKLPGGSYTVALNKISVVSLHEFNLPGGRVTELNIVTEGAGLARFYYMEPSLPGGGTAAAEVARTRLTELANTAAERTGTDKTWEKVQKDYPLATHAHTIEFRLQNKADLTSLHSSAKRAWMTGRGRTVSVAS